MATLLLGVGIFIIGFTAIFIKWAGAPGSVTAFYRFGIASVATAVPFFFHLKNRGWTLPRRGIRLAVAGGLCFGADVALWMTGVMMGEATTPTLMANTAPIWVGLGAFLVFHERQKPAFWSGLIIAMLGAALVLGINFSRSAAFGWGGLLGLMAGVLYAGFHLFTQSGRKLLGTLAYFWIFTTSAALLILIANLILRQPLTGYSANTTGMFLLIGLVGHVGGWICINYAQGHLSASIISISVLGQPVVTAMLAVLLLHDTFSMLQILGGLTVLGGIFLVHYCHLKCNTQFRVQSPGTRS